ncbi:hypothetical protein MNB_SV-12-1 [hydrothermal vent metagenome]|uniref:Uncharacterized protein n=1 Tax=hydrothermal vent metagenome TaxID=652676 RepID=A0A1W1BEX6_9ZZZZ
MEKEDKYPEYSLYHLQTFLRFYLFLFEKFAIVVTYQV